MSRRTSFGKTWWGSAWIDALERIDYNTNRLPRGRRYANNGSVREIKIKDGNVSALVQGSRRTPYKIQIQLNKFAKSDEKRILEIINENPSIAAELSLGNLPTKLLELLDHYSILLLPKSWDSITSYCSCPDWANPCKHLAAVYYIIANEIDKNPFIIFNMCGISTETLLSSSGFSAVDMSPNKKFLPEKFVNSDELQIRSYESEITDIDLSFPQLNINSLFTLITDNPLFSSVGNFRSILLEKYKFLSKAVDGIDLVDGGNRIELNDIDFHIVFPEVKKKKGRRKKETAECLIPESPWLFMSGKGMEKIKTHGEIKNTELPFLRDGKLIFERRQSRRVTDEEMANIFSVQPLNLSLEESSPPARYLNLASSIALALIKSFSFIPKVVNLNDREFCIKYVPLIHDDKIKKAIELLHAMYPPYMIFRESDSMIYDEEPEEYVLSVFITQIIFLLMNKNEPHFKNSKEKIYSAFFYNEYFIAQKFEETNISKAIIDWLEPLSMRIKNFSPIIKIDEIEDELFSVSIEVENKKSPLEAPFPFSFLFENNKTISAHDIDAIRIELLRQTKIVSLYMPRLENIINSKGKQNIRINVEEMFEFLNNTSEVLNLLGIKVIIPRGLKQITSPRLLLKAKAKSSSTSVSYFSLDTLLEFNWQIAIGNNEISVEEFKKLIKSAKGIVKFKDEYLILNPDEVKNILDKLATAPDELSSVEILKTIFGGDYNGILFKPDEIIKNILENILKPEDVSIPENLNATLRHYQVNGFRWLYSNADRGLGSCLADDMGLGKTIQVISLLLKLKEENKLLHPALVICPTTLLGNWYKECQIFAPSLRTFIYHGLKRKLNCEKVDLVITTYGIVRSDLEKFKDIKWEVAVIDEAQNIKNADTNQSHAVKSIKANKYIAMSGTPVENRLSELWSIFDFLNRGYLGSLSHFKKDFSLPIEKYKDKETIEKLRKITSPFILRRLKSDKSIIEDLPDKIIFNEYCYLSKEQTALYEETIKASLKDIKELEGIRRRGLILKLITVLKQICNHPVQFTKNGKPSFKASGKSEKLIELLTKILANKEKTLIFTQYKEMGSLLETMITDQLNDKPLFFHGSVTRLKRDKMVNDFQENKRNKIMILSLKAGGTGLNLTEATNVIHYDLWWNPAVEAQATDRTYRIGQKENVTVYRLLALNTFEEKIDEILKQKKEITDLTISSGENWITELSDRELKELFVMRN